MNDIEKSSVSKLNYILSLHVLVQAAETATTCLFEAEGGLFENDIRIYYVSFRKVREPGTLRLIRYVCKAFSCGGDEKMESTVHSVHLKTIPKRKWNPKHSDRAV